MHRITSRILLITLYVFNALTNENYEVVKVPELDNAYFEDEVKYDGAKVIRVMTKQLAYVQMIDEIVNNRKADRWVYCEDYVDFLVKKENWTELENMLATASVHYEVLVENVQEAIDTTAADVEPRKNGQETMLFSTKLEENGRLMPTTALNNNIMQQGSKITFDRYHQLDDIYSYLNFLAHTYSDFVSVETIGMSVEGRPLQLLKISSGIDEPFAIWMESNTHAREWLTSATVLYIINKLVEQRKNLDKELLETDFYILVIVNPDGFEFSHKIDRLWRKNRSYNSVEGCRGTDLNRNWPVGWGGGGSSKHPCDFTYAGAYEMSEPENQAIANIILKDEINRKLKAYVTFHSYAQMVLYPWGYTNDLPEDADELSRVGKIMVAAIKEVTGYNYSVGTTANIIYQAAGQSIDWAKAIAKIKYSYTIELRDKGYFGFLMPASQIASSGDESFAAITALTKEIYYS